MKSKRILDQLKPLSSDIDLIWKQKINGKIFMEIEFL